MYFFIETELKVYKPAAGKILKRAYWNNENNRREYMDFIKSQLGGTYECLYEINYKHFAQTGGMSCLNIFSQFSFTIVVLNCRVTSSTNL